MIKKMDLCGYAVSSDSPFFLIAGPCVIESEAMAMKTAEALKEIAESLGLFLVRGTNTSPPSTGIILENSVAQMTVSSSIMGPLA